MLEKARPLIGVVVIGRNEGARLGACFASLSSPSLPVVYVDSASCDNSVSIANAHGCSVLELDRSKPLSASRARNEGFARLLELYESVRFVQFIDGDCTLADGWLDTAGAVLCNDESVAAVNGHLSERHPNASIYNRLCAMEWKSKSGDVADFGAFGGISMIRANVFSELGGFNQMVIAGEDSELGVRMSLAGYRVKKLDVEMATHDANMHRFSQWWLRSVRAGHAIGQRADLNGRSLAQDCVKERRSTWFWGVGVPMATVLLLIPTSGLSLILMIGYLVLGIKVYRYRRSMGDSQSDASLYARYLAVAKLANGLGLLKFNWNRLFGRYKIMEYK